MILSACSRVFLLRTSHKEFRFSSKVNESTHSSPARFFYLASDYAFVVVTSAEWVRGILSCRSDNPIDIARFRFRGFAITEKRVLCSRWAVMFTKRKPPDAFDDIQEGIGRL